MHKNRAPFIRLKHFPKNLSAKLSVLFFAISILGFEAPVVAQSKLKVATCQFPVSGNVHTNANYIKNFIREAAIEKANVVHFSEASLTGYPPMDISHLTIMIGMR